MIKKYKVLSILLLLFFAFIIPEFSQAQFQRRRYAFNTRRIKKRGGVNFFSNKSYFSIGVNLYAFNYFGDLAPSRTFLSTEFSFTRPQLGLSLYYRFHPRFNLKASFLYGQLEGSDYQATKNSNLSNIDNPTTGFFRYRRNLHFINDILCFNTIVNFDLIENYGRFFKRPKIPIPYLYLGLSFILHNPKSYAPDSFGGQLVELMPLKTEGVSYSSFVIGLPFGVGARVKIIDNIDVSFEIGWTFAFTDYLDDVSNKYPDLSEMSGLAKAMSNRSTEALVKPSGLERNPTAVMKAEEINNFSFQKRGNPNVDAFTSIGISVIYILKPSLKLSKFR